MASRQAPRTSGLSASPAATRPRRPGIGRGGDALGDDPVLGRGHAEHGHPLALEDVQPLVRVEAGVVQQRRGAAQPRRDEHVAGRLGPAAGRGAPDQLAGAGAEPVLGLDLLAGQVALHVDHRLGLAGGAGSEHDQARVLGRELRRRGGRRGVQALVGDGQHAGSAGPARLELGAVALVGQDQGRLGHREAQPQVAGAQLLVAGQRRRRRCGSRRSSPPPTRGGCRSSVSTTSPGPTPRASSVPARRALRSATSPKAISRRDPSRPSATSAGRSGGAASTTSRAKFTRAGRSGCRRTGRPASRPCAP